jgi:hypothetical protein
MLEVDGRRVSLKYAGKLGCFRVVAHDKVVMPAQSEMIIRGAVDDSANKLTYETDMLVEANLRLLSFVQLIPTLPYLLYHQVSSENYHDL